MPLTKPGRAAGLLALVTVVALTGSGCAAHQTAAAHDADQHATNAGIAMIKHNVDEPAAYAAGRVVGTNGGTTIDALKAQGTTRDGEVLLRITVAEPEQGYDPGTHATRCYRYDLHHGNDDETPHRVDPCPGLAPLVLPSPPPAAPPTAPT
jgi:hypothetical protein